MQGQCTVRHPLQRQNLQVPLSELGKALKDLRFLLALIVSNFIAIPILVGLLVLFFPDDPMIKLGILFVLLTPCIDYVVTFSHLGRADARLLLAATPTLLVIQMLLLPIFLGLFLGNDAKTLVQAGPFVHAFVFLIAIPLFLAGAIQYWAAKKENGKQVSAVLCLFPVPATAAVLFVVVASVVPQLGPASSAVVTVIPFYIVFAILAPLIGWNVSRIFRLAPGAGRAIAFSAGTRNSLVILPLALAVPGAIPILPAIIVTQTLVELISELFYVHYIAKLSR